MTWAGSSGAEYSGEATLHAAIEAKADAAIQMAMIAGRRTLGCRPRMAEQATHLPHVFP
jgi:hypothetical protein